ncbi:hypothetical protein [Oenococcus kitaharae]|uniref:Uncharacterized protein n=1 Tax=Oenococcus kitaharae DSM 17330 TaxID=1045004 RepID=G9WIP1_9LACO|nr:hypothetical protein [Oenococcus kitaharae]EHN58180.1 hypothetical protein OKIT_0051 [Oenococcus kitaharae DSM 17330]OEY81623.1 hypothetical protein NT95_09065 [Oenococcus kitaharae]OEY83108.1 hypothetical protein NV75_07165 [Oenococcus kitaharae]OEY84346.1 hypothetical protein NT96_03470 [Oenococcus kitaharae]
MGNWNSNDLDDVAKQIVDWISKSRQKKFKSQTLSIFGDIKKTNTQYLSKNINGLSPTMLKLHQEYVKRAQTNSELDNLQKTFCHEFGHCYEADQLGYNFILIVLHGLCTTFVFYNNNGQIGFIEYPKCTLPGFSKGIAFFDVPNPTPTKLKDDLNQIAFGGIIQDLLIRNQKSIPNIFSNSVCSKTDRKIKENFNLKQVWVHDYWFLFPIKSTECDSYNAFFLDQKHTNKFLCKIRKLASEMFDANLIKNKPDRFQAVKKITKHL